MFGSVPLKTYLPDGDIDLSIFCGPDAAAALKDTWAIKLQGVLQAEQADEAAPYAVRDVTVINAEVRRLPGIRGSKKACGHERAEGSSARNVARGQRARTESRVPGRARF
jgi:hypothetical protein